VEDVEAGRRESRSRRGGGGQRRGERGGRQETGDGDETHDEKECAAEWHAVFMAGDAAGEKRAVAKNREVLSGSDRIIRWGEAEPGMVRGCALFLMKTTPGVLPVPAGMHTVTPYLVCAGAAQALAFYARAFGAAEVMRLPGPDGRLLHAQLKIGDSMVMLNDEFPEMGSLGPKARGGSSVTIHLFVPDVDEAFARAVAAGAVVRMPLQDMFWGDRYGLVEDPFGHTWSLATRLRDLSPREMAEAAKAACG